MTRGKKPNDGKPSKNDGTLQSKPKSKAKEAFIANMWQPGQSGNPGGRPVMPPEVKEALMAATLPAAQRLAQLIHSDDERIALMASETVLSRIFGKPAQQADVNVTKTETVAVLHLQALQDIAARREARLAGAVDVTPRVEDEGQGIQKGPSLPAYTDHGKPE